MIYILNTLDSKSIQANWYLGNEIRRINFFLQQFPEICFTNQTCIFLNNCMYFSKINLIYPIML